MAIFSIKFAYTSDDIIYRKSAIVRAPTPDSAKDKVSKFIINIVGKPCDNFVFESICVSTHNFVLV